MLRRTLALGFVALLLTTATWGACSSQESVSTEKDGGAEAGGASATGGSGATAGMVGGKGGTAGSSADAGEWGPAAVWEAIPGTAAGCTYERMTNAASIRFLKWEPCPWTDGCEQAAFNPVLFGTSATFTVMSLVFDDGTTVRAGLTMYYQHRMAAFLADDGMGLDGIRVAGGKSDCLIGATSIWGKRFAVDAEDSTASKHFGGILGDIGAMSTPALPFTIPEPPPVGSTQRWALGDARWLWWWTPVDRFSTVSAKDGSGFQIFAAVTFSSTAQMYLDPITTGPLFLSEELDGTDAGHLQAKIVYSDGVAPMKPYLVPENVNDDYLRPAFANNYVGFMKGINHNSINVFDSVEIWATPYSTNPSELKPELVAQYDVGKSAPPMAGGWGRLATVALVPPGGKMGVGIYTLANKSVRTYSIPDDHVSWDLIGLTRTHFWLAAATPLGGGFDAYLMRFKVE